MRARDVLKDFVSRSSGNDGALREGIFSDIYGTLIVHEELNRPYYDFLLWARSQNIPVTLTSSDPGRAVRDLRKLGCDENLVTTMRDKFHLFDARHHQVFEAIIDDSMVLEDVLIYINPASRDFREFLSTSRYKNHGRSHQADLPRPPGP